MILDDIVKLHNDLLQFDSTSPIAVSWNSDHGLIYRQLGIVVALPYMDCYYFPSPKLKLGVLIPSELNKLLSLLETMIQDDSLRKGSFSTIIDSYGIKIYKLYSGLYGPQLTYNLSFVTFTNRLISTIVLKRSDNNSKLLLKAIKNENRIRGGKLRKN